MTSLASPAGDALGRLVDRLAQRIERAPRGGPMVLAALVGLLTGLAAVGFDSLLDLADWFFFDLIDDQLLGGLPRWRLLLIPALGGLLVGPIVTRFARETRGQGVSDVMLAMETQHGRIRGRVAPTMAVTTALTLGSGGPAGRQGPVVQIGAGLGSWVAQTLHLSNDNIALLAAAGAAGGVAAAFNAPIAGVFFALEVVLRSFSTRNFSVVMIAALAATVVSASMLGDEPVISIPEYRLEHAVEIAFYALLGVLAGFVGVAFIRLIHIAEDRLAALPLRSKMLVPALGGALVGSLALIDAGVLGEGKAVMDDVLNERTATGAMLLLLLLKPLAAASTLGSGGSGGVFGPSLFLGAVTGGAFGAILHGALPALTAGSGVYATVGMAAVFAAVSHAPISAVLILFEMTRDYGIMLPLMTAVATATLISQMVGEGSIYATGLERRGVLIEEEPGPVSVMESLTVADAMSPVQVTAAPDDPLLDLMRAQGESPDSPVLVLDDDGEIAGLITGATLNAVAAAGDVGASAAEIANRSVPTVFADQTLHEAMAILGGRDIEALPVVDRSSPRAPCGILRRSDITQAYSTAMEQTAAATRRRRLARVTSDDVRYLELRVARESGLDGRLLNEVRLTEDAVIVAVRHAGVTVIPRGHTRLAEGDRVTVLAASVVVEQVRAIFEGPPT